MKDYNVLENDEQLLDLMEEMQEQIEGLQKELSREKETSL